MSSLEEWLNIVHPNNDRLSFTVLIIKNLGSEVRLPSGAV